MRSDPTAWGPDGTRQSGIPYASCVHLARAGRADLSHPGPALTGAVSATPRIIGRPALVGPQPGPEHQPTVARTPPMLATESTLLPPSRTMCLFCRVPNSIYALRLGARGGRCK